MGARARVRFVRTARRRTPSTEQRPEKWMSFFFFCSTRERNISIYYCYYDVCCGVYRWEREWRKISATSCIPLWHACSHSAFDGFRQSDDCARWCNGGGNANTRHVLYNIARDITIYNYLNALVKKYIRVIITACYFLGFSTFSIIYIYIYLLNAMEVF